MISIFVTIEGVYNNDNYNTVIFSDIAILSSSLDTI